MDIGRASGLPVPARGRWSAVRTVAASRGAILASGVALAVSLVILYLAIRSWVDQWPLVVAAWGADYDFFLMVADRWLSTGEFYAAHQLAGPYEADINTVTLYPPAALFLFLPFVWLPAVLWWTIPLATIAVLVVRWRPSIWVWPFLALMLWWPRTQSIIVWGNTGMWVAAFLALALRYRWPGALILIKPSLAPFALIDIRSRGWWVAAIVLGLVSLPMLPDYITAMRNNVGAFPGLDYSVQDIPFIAIPLVSWLARADRGEVSPATLGHPRSGTSS